MALDDVQALDPDAAAMRFDDLSKTYTRLYDMTYRDSQWMDKLATVAARQFTDAIEVLGVAKGRQSVTITAASGSCGPGRWWSIWTRRW